jgi:hypothetical protein
MESLNRILATTTTILGVPLIWHAVMPSSVCWMTREQICGTFLLFLLTSAAYIACWIVKKEIEQ